MDALVPPPSPKSQLHSADIDKLLGENYTQIPTCEMGIKSNIYWANCSSSIEV